MVKLDKSKYREIHTIKVKEILSYEKRLFFKDVEIVSARIELQSYLKEIASKEAYTLGGFVKAIRSLTKPPITSSLEKYIKSINNRKLKKDIKSLMIATYGGSGSYSVFNLQEGWYRVKRGFFWHY